MQDIQQLRTDQIVFDLLLEASKRLNPALEEYQHSQLAREAWNIIFLTLNN